MLSPFRFCVVAVAAAFVSLGCAQSEEKTAGLRFDGKAGPASGKRVVLIAGDEEYRSEEALPMLAKILSQRHGFECTVVFPIDAERGIINPNVRTNLPGLEALDRADLMIVATRFRQLPDDQLKRIARYLQAGKPVIGLRTATHAFTGDAVTDGIEWKKFGPLVLGEGWVAHHGVHNVEGARSVVPPGANHAVLNGVGEIFGPSDVYTVKPRAGAEVVLLGEVTATLAPDSAAVEGAKNNPMMPIAWFRTYEVPNGTAGRAFTCTMGAAVDFLDENLRRLVVNAAYALTGLTVPARAEVAVVDPYAPSYFGFVKDNEVWNRRALRVADFELGKSTEPLVEVKAPESWAESSRAQGAAR